MFDLWRKIAENGAAAVPAKTASLAPLAWVEVGEKYPELMPDEFRGYDIYSDPQLIQGSPFVVVASNDGKSFHFKTKDPVGGNDFDLWVDPFELVDTLGQEYFHTDDEISAFGGILVCSCGIACCAGIWSQTFHVSKKMVHWSIVYDEDKIDLYFERETYEKGALTMIRTLLEKPEEFTLPGQDGSLCGDVLEALKSKVEKMLERRPYFREMWNEVVQGRKARGDALAAREEGATPSRPEIR